MSAYRVHLRGRGRAEVGAYGMADAEHQVEKELVRAWPGVGVRIEEIGRPAGASRLVETFRVGWMAEGWIDAEGATPEEARRDAFRRARAFLEGTRYWMARWEATLAEER